VDFKEMDNQSYSAFFVRTKDVSDNDPLFQSSLGWNANLRILHIKEVKSIPSPIMMMGKH
jgi:hypothetical protein